MSSRANSPAGFSGWGKVLPGRDVDRVGAGLLEPAADLHRVLDRVPRAEPREEGVRVLGRRDLHLDVEVVPDLGPDRLDGVEEQPRAVLERPAVLVLALVDGRGEELREEVAVRAVDLDAVEPCLPGAAGPRGERALDRLQVGPGRALGLEAVQRVGLARRGEPLAVRERGDVALAPGVRELDDVLAVVLVDALAELAPERDRARRSRCPRSWARSSRARRPRSRRRGSRRRRRGRTSAPS